MNSKTVRGLWAIPLALALLAATGAKVKDYTVAPVYLSLAERGGHEWLIEFEEAPPSLDEFASLLDNNLRGVNSDYNAKRTQDLALVAPVVRAMPPDTFYNWLKQRGKLGGQHKVPRLSNDRSYVEEILSMIGTEAL